ncbi:MAG: YbhB/YbcL family Raf kinase inhibitor-like protein [Rhodanobacteraceae bacterium]
MELRSDSFQAGQPIPEEFAFARPSGDEKHVVWAGNRNPHLAWTGAPLDTRSFVLFCVDRDVPSVGDDVNQEGRSVAIDLPRVEFVHWVMANIPGECRELAAGSCADGVVAHGKNNPIGPPNALQGLNSYTDWFAGDDAMRGDYRGYDGPCPPWNDERVHRYVFEVFALDVPTLGLPEGFRIADVRATMSGHVLDEGAYSGTYTLNPALRG